MSDLIKSYLSERSQFVEVDGARSHTKKALDCSVIQGSKMAGLFYTLYRNEVTSLYELLQTQYYTTLTNHNFIKFSETVHVTINFVDDSSNIIGFKSFDTIKNYLQNYYQLLQNYYNINKLLINPDKNQVMICAKPKYQQDVTNFSFKASQYTIKNKSSIKILGIQVNHDLNIDNHLNYVTSKCYNVVHNIKNCLLYTSPSPRD